MNDDFDFNLQDLLDETDEDDNEATETPVELDLNVIKTQLPSYTTQKVAEMVVCSRYLGFDNEITTTCMEELAKRREAGDIFPFESFIEAATKTLPPLSVGIPDLRTMLSQVSKKGARTR